MGLELRHYVGVEQPRRIVLVKVFNNLMDETRVRVRACPHGWMQT